MKYIIDLPTELYERILHYNSKKNIKNVSQFIQYAVENQFILENSEEGPLKISNKKSVNPVTSFNAKEGIKKEFCEGFRFYDITWDVLNPEKPKQIQNQIMWGQHNRILPLKVSLRVLSKNLALNNNELSQSEFYNEIFDIAVQVRKYLEKIDKKHQIPRGKRLSTGFPVNRDESIQRFKAHFIGYLQKDKKAVGPLPTLGFINITDLENNFVNITYPGLEFSKLSNPIIDDKNEYKALSDKEIEFFLTHIETNIPQEFLFINKILTLISSETATTPDSLTSQIHLEHPYWTKKVANTMRGGALARMQELDLISMKRDGLNFSYLVTENGQKIMERKIFGE